MVNAYFILEDGEQQGPYTFDELIEMEIDIHTRVLSPLADTWEDACDLPEFYPYFLSQGVYFPTEDNLASFWWRLLAFAIDFFILAFLIRFLLFILAERGVKINLQSHQTLLEAILCSMLIFYFSISEASGIQGSPGKKMCRLVVVDGDGMGITFTQALLRSMGKTVCLFLAGIPFISIFLSETNQALHDYLAGTYVVRLD